MKRVDKKTEKKIEKKTLKAEKASAPGKSSALANFTKIKPPATKKSVASTEKLKPAKGAKIAASAKVSVPPVKAKKSVPVKAVKQAVIATVKAPVKPPTVKKKPAAIAAAAEKPVKKAGRTAKEGVKKASPAAVAKIPAAGTKSKKAVASIPAAKSKIKIAVAPDSAKAAKPKRKQAVPIVAEKTANPKKQLVASKIEVKKTGKAMPKKVAIVIPPIMPRAEKKTAAKEISLAKSATAKTPAKKAEKIENLKPALNSKILKKRETPAKKVVKKTEKKIEIVIPPIEARPVRKKLKPIGSAVVRGKSGRYDFEVFPLDADLKDGSAIYVISKRITDKSGRGHHKFVCIGQTESLIGEIKKHKKDKCIKQHKANVICLLREESAANRVKIETDLREAHAIACNQK